MISNPVEMPSLPALLIQHLRRQNHRILSSIMNVHPSQRRLACEACKKHKARCQRIQQTDLKCSRCTMLGVDCDPGRQKRIGRPRRSALVSEPSSSRTTSATSDAKLLSKSDDRRRVNKEYRRLQSESENISSHRRHSRNVTSAPMPLPSPATTPPTTLHGLIYNPMSALLSVSPEPPRHNLQSWTPSTRLLNTVNDEASLNLPYATTFIPSPASSAEDEFCNNDSAWPIAATIHVQPGSIAWLYGPTSLGRDVYSKATGALYVDIENRTITNDAASATIDYAVQPDNSHTLSRIGLELELRCVVIEHHKSTLDLDALIYQHGPLFINNFTLGEFLLGATQDFLQVLTRLLESMKWKTNIGSSTAIPPGRLSHTMACNVTGIFTQLISFYELFLEHLTSRIERISTYPVTPIPGLTFNGRPLAGPCDQGLLFCHVVLSLLEGLENVLGLTTKGEAVGLLSAEQIDDLWSQLDSSDGVASGRGIMRPTDVKSLFRKVATVIKRLSPTMRVCD